MKRKFKPKETWDSFEKSGCETNCGMNVPNDILVQRMSPNASGRLNNYNNHNKITIDNVKEACEKFYRSPEGSCDILASDRGHRVPNLNNYSKNAMDKERILSI